MASTYELDKVVGDTLELTMAMLDASAAALLMMADRLDDRRTLLQQLDGVEVEVGVQSRMLETGGLAVYQHPVDWRSDFLAVITNPNMIQSISTG